jgi:hypothetical protein
MATTEVVVRGAVTADGRLVLDEQPQLPPGRVEVTVRPVGGAAPGRRTTFEALEEIWADLDAQGVRGRTGAEAVADVRALRDEWDAHQERLEELQDRLRAKREERSKGEGRASEPALP